LPLVVLDASGRVRATYDDLATTMRLKRLPAAAKDYSNLTIADSDGIQPLIPTEPSH
jgi:hypothetical protein